MIFLSPIYPENRQYIHDRKNSYLSVTVTPPIENFTLFTSIVYLVLPLIVNANIHLNVCLYMCVSRFSISVVTLTIECKMYWWFPTL